MVIATQTHESESVARRSTEWATVALGVAVFAAFLSVTFLGGEWPLWVLLPLLAITSAWHSSFQHELLHGHPFANQTVNDVIGLLSPQLWIPYREYRRTHLLHHRNEFLTTPGIDPESYYTTRAIWDARNPFEKALFRANRTLLGRLTIGPVLVIASSVKSELPRVINGDDRARRSWAEHIVANGIVLWWVVTMCHMRVWVYLVGAVYGGLALVLNRSFVEHRFVGDDHGRTALVQAGPFFSLLYLNNNLHDTHHERPGAPWHALPALCLELDSVAKAALGGGAYRGYWDVARHYGVRSFDQSVHPSEIGLQSKV